MVKFVKLSEKTRVLLNEVKALILHTTPKINKVTDDGAIYKSLDKYKKGDKDGNF